MSYNGWTNWETCESYLVITSNDEKAYYRILRQLKKSDYLGIRSIVALLKQHNKRLKKDEWDHLIIDLNVVNMSELVETLKEELEV